MLINAVVGLILIPLMFDNALASIQTDGPRRLELAYEAILPVPVIGRIKAAEATISAEISPTSYSVRSRAQAAGVVDWFIDYNLFLTASGSASPRSLKPARYVSSNKDGKKNRQVTVDFYDQDVATTVTPKFGDYGFPPATLEQKLEAKDPLSAIVQLALAADATPENPCGGPIRAFDGKLRFDIVLTFAGRMNWKSDYYTGPALKCDVTYVEIAGFKQKTEAQKAKDAADMLWTNMILAELDGGAVTPPIKIEGRSKKRGKMTVEATRIAWGPATPAAATGR